VSSGAGPSAPFASRTFNGEQLLDELADLRSGLVSQNDLNELHHELRALQPARTSEVVSRLRVLASGRFAQSPVGALLTRWAQRLKTPTDASLLMGHVGRLAVASALLSAVRQAAPRLKQEKRRE
jgi:hypothetical protein